MAARATSTVTSISPHTADPIIQPFLQHSFDPATYLNNTLPSLSTPNTRSAHGSSVPLADLSSQTQALLNQLNAQTSRLSNTLTQLTDEIIRSGGRLAYEVEVLRGETTGLSDALEGGLKKDIDTLAPAKQPTPEDVEANGETSSAPEPAHLQNLRTLSLLRARLDGVIRVFGEATAWPLAPSETASSFIAVSAPGDTAEARDREAKAKGFADGVRSELQDLLSSATDGGSLEAASQRVEELRRLAEVWKGTAEEKARRAFVESLEEMVQDRRRMVGRSGVAREPRRAADMRYGDLSGSGEGTGGGGGFLSGLRRMGDGLYIE